jgi:hypothetical protein
MKGGARLRATMRNRLLRQGDAAGRYTGSFLKTTPSSRPSLLRRSGAIAGREGMNEAGRPSGRVREHRPEAVA